MTLVGLLENEPLALAALTVLLAALVYYQRRMPLSLALAISPTKERACIALDPLSRRALGLRLANDKSGDDEFVLHLDPEPHDVAQALHPPFQPNLIANAKPRTLDQGRGTRRQTPALQLATRYEDDQGRQRQTHAYLYRAPGGGTDAYAHVEDDNRNPLEHLSPGDHHPGDEDGRLIEALRRARLYPTEEHPDQHQRP